MTRAAVSLLLVTIACGGTKPTSATPDNHGEPPSTTELERRRDATCESLGPRITECAIADARSTLPPDEFAKLDLEKTAPVHTQKFIDSCKGQTMSSRQVRVYEVCQREETECEPLMVCLDHAKPEATAAP